MVQKGRREITGISFEPDIFEWIEEGRGHQNRSKYLNQVLKKVFGLKVEEMRDKMKKERINGIDGNGLHNSRTKNYTIVDINFCWDLGCYVGVEACCHDYTCLYAEKCEILRAGRKP